MYVLIGIESDYIKNIDEPRHFKGKKNALLQQREPLIQPQSSNNLILLENPLLHTDDLTQSHPSGNLETPENPPSVRENMQIDNAQATITTNSSQDGPKQFDIIDDMVYINEEVSFSKDVWDALDLTMKPSILARNTAVAIWRDLLPSKCLDLKAKPRSVGQERSLCSPKKLEALYDVVAYRFKKSNINKSRASIIKICRQHLSSKITDLNTKKLSATEIRDLQRRAADNGYVLLIY
ncbi:uncharacterized protein LOC127287299 [Leptopilina boulardi]|uniref:uncharacterized protein LOC127287299 n=1 Tax=Leptopilina boulardi TaxID=63433 RepID=UPI0021F50108|nr:uncharacterized protein LOC127287299 [Leptopilina boulardi]